MGAASHHCETLGVAAHVRDAVRDPVIARRRPAPAVDRGRSAEPLTSLQHAAGNAAVARAIHCMPKPGAGRSTCGAIAGPGGECTACRAARIGGSSAQRAPLTPEPVTPMHGADAPAGDGDHAGRVRERLGPGRPLDGGLRSRVEPVFGQDFSGVRVHTDASAASLTAGLNARAFTVGDHIALAMGEYRPGTVAGDAILAHELAHVVQQSGARPTATPVRDGSPAYEALERDADAAASGVIARLWGGAKAVVAGGLAGASPQMRAGLGVQRAPGPKRPGTPSKGLPPVRVQSGPRTAEWLLEFDTWVTRDDLIRALFSGRELPAAFTLEPTRRSEKDQYLSMYWTMRWTPPLEAHRAELTEFAQQLRLRALQGGEEFAEDTRRREADEEAARAANREHNKMYVPALGMTGGEALRTLKPGIYIGAVGRPLRAVPTLVWRDKRPDVSWIWGYVFPDGVFVWVGATEIQIRELGHPADESFWATMLWFMQHGDDLHAAEKRYIELMTQLNFMMIAGMAMAYTTAPSFGPRANVAEEALSLAGAGRTASRDVGTLGHVNPLEAVGLAIQGYGVVQMDAEMIREARERGEAEAAREAQAALERGDLFQLPGLVAEDAGAETDDPASVLQGVAPSGSVQRAPKVKGAAAPPIKGKLGLPVRDRVTGFVNDVAAEYRDGIVAAHKKYWADTASVVGTEAEKTTLAKVPDLARRWGLRPSKIWIGDFPVGVTGRKGGPVTAEMGSSYYKFMVEMKKSPGGDRPWQMEAHYLGLEEGMSFPKGGRHFHIYGERFGRGRGILVHEVPPPKVKP